MEENDDQREDGDDLLDDAIITTPAVLAPITQIALHGCTPLNLEVIVINVK